MQYVDPLDKLILDIEEKNKVIPMEDEPRPINESLSDTLINLPGFSDCPKEDGL